jgi:aspartate/methionine/tyrosine aminotransferase
VRDQHKSNLVFPEGLPDLREALAAHYTALAGVPVPSSRIFVDAGTSSVYPTLFRLLASPGDEVLLPLPYYPLYRVSALLADAFVRYYRIRLDTMRVDMKSFAQSLTEKTRIIVLNSPGNPLGNVITRGELSQMLDLLPEHAYVVFDEIYENVVFGPEPGLAPALLGCDSRNRGHLIVTNSCSKGYRMYTKRVGWCVLPESLAVAMRIILQHTRLTVDPAVQYGAVEALRHPEEVEIVCATHRNRRKYAHAHLQKIPGVRLLSPAGGFYCTLDCRGFIHARRIDNCLSLALDVLERSDVATVPGEDFGLPGTLRLSFTASRFDEAINRLVRYFRGSR